MRLSRRAWLSKCGPSTESPAPQNLYDSKQQTWSPTSVLVFPIIAVEYSFLCWGHAVTWYPGWILCPNSLIVNPENHPMFLRKATATSWELPGNACVPSVFCYCWRVSLDCKDRRVIVEVCVIVANVPWCPSGLRALSSDKAYSPGTCGFRDVAGSRLRCLWWWTSEVLCIRRILLIFSMEV